MDINYQKIQIGDRLVRTKGGVFSKHHAVYAGFHENQHIVAENQIKVGVRYILLNQFLKEGTLKRIDYNKHSVNAQEQIIERINNKMGATYSILNYNCEHFANEILTGIKESKQVKTGISLSIIATLCALAFGNKFKK